MKKFVFIAGIALILPLVGSLSLVAQKSAWRAATQKELAAVLPDRAPVEKEHIETEISTASGITNGHGRFIAGVVLITAGYSADGKYSHYLIVQTPVKVGGISLTPGEYVFGWEKCGDDICVHFHEALSGKLLGSVEAHRIQSTSRVEILRIWPPSERPLIQIGRFGVPYELGDE